MATRVIQDTKGDALAYDAGLRAYLLKIYNYMAVALALTGAVAFFTASSEPILDALYVMHSGQIVSMTLLGWIVLIAPLFMVLFLAARVPNMSLGGAQTAFWIYAALIGLSLASIFLVYTGASIARVFFITAGTFAGMSLYGYTTRRDLTQFGSFLMMGLFGLIIAMLFNLFLRSPAMYFATSVIGVFIFVGLTAFDTQRLKALYSQVSGSEAAGKVAILGALTLYLDFLNIFIHLLPFLGTRR